MRELIEAVASHPQVSALVREMSRRAAREWKGHAEACPLGYAAPPCGEPDAARYEALPGSICDCR